MKLYKQIEIPLDQYRAQLSDINYNYTDKEKAKLTILYNLFEQGQFKECINFSMEWNREDREMIAQDIWDILMDVSMGCDNYKI